MVHHICGVMHEIVISWFFSDMPYTLKQLYVQIGVGTLVSSQERKAIVVLVISRELIAEGPVMNQLSTANLFFHRFEPVFFSWVQRNVQDFSLPYSGGQPDPSVSCSAQPCRNPATCSAQRRHKPPVIFSGFGPDEIDCLVNNLENKTWKL